jgi:hypothetical protein
MLPSGNEPKAKGSVVLAKGECQTELPDAAEHCSGCPRCVGPAAGAAVEVQRMHRGIRYCKVRSGGEKKLLELPSLPFAFGNQEDVDDTGALLASPNPVVRSENRDKRLN